MGDVYYAVCGEPWDYYGVYQGDMTLQERRQFLAGKGCPCCKGKKPKGREQENFEQDFYESLLENMK
jgi:hypothetical protein